MRSWNQVRPKAIQLLGLGVVLTLLLALACGAAATATPAPPAAKPAAPAAPAAPALAAPAAAATPAATAVPTAAPRPTPAPVAKAKVDRLKFAMSPQINETPLTWLGTGVDANVQTRHYAEPLIQTDNRTGALIPGLATSWQMTTPDGKTWTFKLRKGVAFHSNWGEFTAKDVPHTFALIMQDGAIATDTPLLKALLGKTEAEMRQNVQTPDDHTVVLKLLGPRVDMDYVAGTQTGNLFMYSKAQWDKEGLEGYKKRPAGTGPWQFVEWQLGQWMLFRRVDNHWRKTPEFKEFQLFRVPEATTRLAMLLAGEADMSEIDRALHKDAVSKGMKVVNTQLPSIQFGFIMGGVYHPGMPTYDPNTPLVNVKVREAINRSINRTELVNTILGGEGSPQVVWGYHSTLEGWNSDWEKRFQDKYAYDPARARALLKEAGYPDGFKTTVVVTSLPGAPEMIDGAQALPLYLNKIGIEVKTVEMEFAKLRDAYRAAKTHDLIYPIRGSYRPLEPTLRFYNISGKEGFHQVVPDKILDVKYQQFVNSVDVAERERILKEIGEFKFINYTEIPIAWLPGQILVNPKVVGEYIFPGNINGPLSHLEYVKPAQ